MVGFDFRRQEREVRGGRVESLWSDSRLSRELEEGFRDDSEDDEDDHRGDEEEDRRRRMVYEVKAGKVKHLGGGVAAWETTLEKRLVKAGLV